MVIGVAQDGGVLGYAHAYMAAPARPAHCHPRPRPDGAGAQGGAGWARSAVAEGGDGQRGPAGSGARPRLVARLNFAHAIGLHSEGGFWRAAGAGGERGEHGEPECGAGLGQEPSVSAQGSRWPHTALGKGDGHECVNSFFRVYVCIEGARG